MDKERLSQVTEALYRVTDLMPDEEPLKWTLRRQALGILKLWWLINGENVFKKRLESRVKLAKSIEAVLSLLELASSTLFLSRLNFQILEREYQAIGDILNGETPANSEVSEVQVGASTSHLLETNQQDEESLQEFEARKEKILEFLGKYGSMSVGELSGALGKEMSQKTLQRTLSLLAQAGVIKRAGDKRWRKYSISIGQQNVQ